MKKKVVKGLAVGAGIFSFHAFIGFVKASLAFALCSIIGIGCLIGGISKSVKKETYYETSVTFYINPVPEKEAASGESVYATYGSYSTNVMNNIVKLLGSEVFAEQLLDDLMDVDANGNANNEDADKYGFPLKKTDENSKTGLTKSYENWIKYLDKNLVFTFEAEGSIAESFITVKMTRTATAKTEESRKLAEETLFAIQRQAEETVATFVKQNMPKPSGYVDTNCKVIDKTQVPTASNTANPKSSAMKFAIVVGAFATIVAAIAVIASYMSDKRVRDVEEITKVFNLPVLGVIPVIDEKSINQTNNKKTKKDQC